MGEEKLSLDEAAARYREARDAAARTRAARKRAQDEYESAITAHTLACDDAELARNALLNVAQGDS